ncbi:MAG: hypothetical protein ACREIT_10135 [Tepidisphaeraceae bacterium]
MLKPLICLLAAFAVAVALLQLRQQRLNLAYQNNQLHKKIESSQSKLWNQQLQIAVFTAPNAIARTVGEHDLHMRPRAPLPARGTNWLDARNNPDAE